MNADMWLDEKYDGALGAVLDEAKWQDGPDECRLEYRRHADSVDWFVVSGPTAGGQERSIDKHMAGALLIVAAWRWLEKRKPTWPGGWLFWNGVMRFCPDCSPLDVALATAVKEQLERSEARL